MALTAHLVTAADNSPWSVPPKNVKLDFTAKDLPKKITFLDEGLAYEVPVNFVMFRRERVTIEAALPGPGELKVAQTNPVACVDVRTLGAPEGTGKVDFVLKTKIMTLEDVQRRAKQIADTVLADFRKSAEEETEPGRGKNKEAKAGELAKYLRDHGLQPPLKFGPLRDRYIDVRTGNLGKETILRELTKLAEKRQQWLTASDQKKWPELPGHQLYQGYSYLLRCDVAADYLKQFGLEPDTSRTTFANVLAAKVTGVHKLWTGDEGDSDDSDDSEHSEDSGDSDDSRRKREPQLLRPTEISRLGKSLTVNALCRFVSAADPKDPNAQWFNGQRVASVIRYVASVRVEGALDPASHDHVDWWRLAYFDSNSVAMQFPETAGLHYEMFTDVPGEARLRIVAAGKKPVAYSFLLRPRSPGTATQKVVIHEAPAMTDIRFPF